MLGAFRSSSPSSSHAGAPSPGASPSGAPSRRAPVLASLRESVVVRVVGYYVVLFAAAFALWRMLPPAAQVDAVDTFAPMLDPRGVFDGATPMSRAGAAAQGIPGAVGREPVAVTAVAAALGAFLLALPVAWIYMFTHAKKGYRQSSVHALVLLPVVVASVTVLVKNSLALAFALAGIVAAVRFRTSLEDSKDAVYLFLVTALGLAAGVELDVAVAVSITFNAIVLLLWYTDFARTPPALEGVRAQRRLEEAIALANRTSQFVARVDQEILQSLAPAQLEALAERVGRRRAELSSDLPGAAGGRFDAKLHVATTDAEALRAAIEPALERNLKRWRCQGVRPRGNEDDDEITVVEYDVRWRRDAPPGVVLDAVREAGAPHVVRVTVVRDDPTAASASASNGGSSRARPTDTEPAPARAPGEDS